MSCTVTIRNGVSPHARAVTQPTPPKVIRVAAYCRVSTDAEEQQTSMREQMEVFEKRIREHDGWELAGIYSDAGISGTSTKKRADFQRMIRDAETGKINYIITKSLSRFARNTLDCLTYVRKLQALGVGVLFEKENIDTGTAMSEMILTVLAAFAQEESRSISSNLKWGLRKGFESGQVRWSPIYGYRKGEKAAEAGSATAGTDEDSHETIDWLIVPEESEVVCRIFALYEHGKDSVEITNTLNEEAVPSPTGKRWCQTVVTDILDNEKYIGDFCAQKFYNVDHLTHRDVPNNKGLLPSYYMENHHTAIVDKKTFDRVQKIRRMRNDRNSSGQYPYGEVSLICPHCGQKLVQCRTRHSRVRMLWGCFGEHGCQGYALKTWQLDEAVRAAYEAAYGNDASDGKTPPAPEKIEFWWLDEYVASIEPNTDNTVTVRWKDGRVSAGSIPIRSWAHEPEMVLKHYKNYLMHCAEKKHCAEKAHSELKTHCAEAAAQPITAK